MQLHTVGNRRHSVFTDTEVQVSTCEISGGEIAVGNFVRVFHIRKVGRSKVSRTADKRGHFRRELIKDFCGRLTGCHRLVKVVQIVKVSIYLPDGFGTEIRASVMVHPAKKMIIPASVTEIGESAFEGSAAEEFILPDGITTIGSRAFAGSNVKLINIPESVTYIAPDAFEGCEDLFIFAIYGSYGETWAEQSGFSYGV